MPEVYFHRVTVSSDDIDPQGHASNIVYLEWMQSAAVAHSSAQGWTGTAYRERGWAWVVRTHHIEYRRPAFAEDDVVVKTWVADMQRFTSRRRYEILRGTMLLARAETNWAFVETQTGRLRPVPEEVAAAFEIAAERPE